MSQIPPYQMNQPPGGPPQRSNNNVWLWVLLGMAGMCVVCGVIGAAILFPVFSQARLAAQSTAELSKAKQVAIGMVIYTADYDDKLPPFKSAEEVSSKLTEYIKEPSAMKAAKTYTWNLPLSGKLTSGFESTAVVWLFHSSTLDAGKRYEVGYLDTHAKRLSQENLDMMKSDSEAMVKKYNPN